MTTVSVVDRDITQVEADAMIMAANTLGNRGGHIDQAVYRVAGNMFFEQLDNHTGLIDGQTVFAPATSSHNGSFTNVVFVVDNLRRPLNEIVTNALKEADRQQQASISIPAFRTGYMAGVYEASFYQVADNLVRGIRDFIATGPVHVQHISVVIYGNQGLKNYVASQL